MSNQLKYIVFISSCCLTVPIAAETYTIDSQHSFANWQVRHLVSKVAGTFHQLSGTIAFNPNQLEASKVFVTIDVLSLNSDHQERDAHLLSADFLDALQFREIRFMSQSVKKTSEDSGVLKGELTLHGVTKTIEFPFRILGIGKNPATNQTTVGFEAYTSLKRSDYNIIIGLNESKTAPIGDEIAINLLIEAVKQK